MDFLNVSFKTSTNLYLAESNYQKPTLSNNKVYRNQCVIFENKSDKKALVILMG